MLIEKLLHYKHLDYLKIIENIQLKKEKLLNIIEFISGTQPPKSEHIYEYEDGYIRFVQNRDYSTDNHITYIKESKKNKICDKYDIMMDKYGEAGKVRFGIAGAYNVALSKINPKSANLREFIREYFRRKDIEQYLANSSIASTRASVSEENLNNLYIDIPIDLSILNDFENRHKLIIDYILSIKEENARLNNLKTTYLSKFFK